MKVAFVCGTLCVRAYKEAHVLSEKGFEIYAICNQLANNLDAKPFVKIDYYKKSDDLIKLMKTIKPNIIHVHNTPDWMACFLKAWTKFPLVHDVHDVFMYPNQYYPDLDDAVKVADAVITVSNRCAIELQKLTPKTAPYVVHSGSISKLTRSRTKFSDGKIHLVYLSSFYRPELIKPLLDKIENHLSNKNNIIVHCICNTDVFIDLLIDEFKRRKIFKLEKKITNQFELSNVLSAYDIGIISEYFTQDALQLPNKTFDYIAAGLPVVSFKSRETAFLGDWAKSFEDWDGKVWKPTEMVNPMMDGDKIVKIYSNLLK